jgi:large subunit ribosomal protein L15
MAEYKIKKPDSIKKRKRVGRGMSSGCGKTSSRGMNGQRARSGSVKRPWFEGGQMPLYRRVPKRGFNNYFKKYFQLVNVSSLEKLSESEINAEVLLKNGLISELSEPVKILGNGEIKKAVNVIAEKFSKSAKSKIEKAGGKIIEKK